MIDYGGIVIKGGNLEHTNWPGNQMREIRVHFAGKGLKKRSNFRVVSVHLFEEVGEDIIWLFLPLGGFRVVWLELVVLLLIRSSFLLGKDLLNLSQQISHFCNQLVFPVLLAPLFDETVGKSAAAALLVFFAGVFRGRFFGVGYL